MPEILQAIRENGLALVALVLVSGAVVILARTLYHELTDRRLRAEKLVDELMEKFDRATAVTSAALDELRKRT